MTTTPSIRIMVTAAPELQPQNPLLLLTLSPVPSITYDSAANEETVCSHKGPVYSPCPPLLCTPWPVLAQRSPSALAEAAPHSACTPYRLTPKNTRNACRVYLDVMGGGGGSGGGGRGRRRRRRRRLTDGA